MAAKKSTPKAAASKADKQVSAKPASKVAAKPEKKVAPAKKESEPAKAAKKPEVVESPAPAAANGHANGSVSHSSSFVDKQKQRLLDLRDELVDAMTGTTRDTIRNAPEGSEASGSGMHQGD